MYLSIFKFESRILVISNFESFEVVRFHSQISKVLQKFQRRIFLKFSFESESVLPQTSITFLILKFANLYETMLGANFPEIRGQKIAEQAAKDGSPVRASWFDSRQEVKGLVYGTPAGQNSSTWYPFLDGTSTGRFWKGEESRGARGPGERS